MSMRIEEWWQGIAAETQQWLIDHNGEAVPEHIVEQIRSVEGIAAADMSWVGPQIPEGFFLSDGAVDWIEAVANGETPLNSEVADGK